MQIHDATRDDIKQQTLDHLVGAVSNSMVESFPFPHFIVHGMFPDAVYRDLLGSLPDASLYEAFSYEKHQADDGASNRGRFKLTNDSLDRLSGAQRSLWLGVRDALGAPEFKQAVFGQLSEGLAYRFGVPAAEVPRLKAYPLPELFRETRGYSIKPHPDTRRKVVTMQIALPKDARQRNLGTEFYRRSLNPLHVFREPRGFEIVKRAPFLPNVGYAFSVLNTIALKSWHGRTAIEGETGVRNTILNIWYTKAADANPDICQQYYRAAA